MKIPILAEVPILSLALVIVKPLANKINNKRNIRVEIASALFPVEQIRQC